MQTGAARSWVPWAVGIFSTLVVLGLIVVIFGSVSGEEFDPWRFRRQHYQFMQVPIVRWQIRPTRYDDITGPAEIAIGPIIGAPILPAFTVDGEDEPGEENDNGGKDGAADKVATKNIPSRWDLVETRRAGAAPWAGDAKILCDALDTRNHRYDSFWEVWTTKHPAAAKVLWPMVARTAQSRLYILIPDLLDIAAKQKEESKAGKNKKAKAVRQFSKDLERVIKSDSLKLANAFLNAKKPEQALQAYELVLEYEPDSKAAAEGVVSATAAIQSAEKSKAESTTGEVQEQQDSQVATPVAEVESEFSDDHFDK